jgi:hypothetical protein
MKVLTDCQETHNGESRKEEVGSSVVEVGQHHGGYETNDTDRSAESLGMTEQYAQVAHPST